MDIADDFKLPAIRVGDLVEYAEYKYHPNVYSKADVDDGTIGIVVRIDTTHMGYEIHYVMWLKPKIMMPTPRGNLKLVYSKKQI